MIVDSGNLNGLVTVAPSDTWAPPTKLDIQAGETYRRRNLLQGG